jgi:hypothetical protein
MTLPTVHLNGTSKAELQDGYYKAYIAVKDALRALENIEFNARDYYVQEPGAWNKARAERIEQAEKLQAVANYLDAHLEYLMA